MYGKKVGKQWCNGLFGKNKGQMMEKRLENDGVVTGRLELNTPMAWVAEVSAEKI